MTRHAWALLLLLAMWLPVAGAEETREKDGLVLCNQGKAHSLYAAVVSYTGNLLIRSWTSMGWFIVRPGRCQQLIEGTNFVNNTYYLSVVKIQPGAPKVIYMSPKAREEEVFCVREIGKFRDGFELRRATLAELRECPPDYTLQLFNFRIDSKEFARYTMTLN